MIKTKNILADSLISILKNKQYNDITITDIAKISNINRSTYYRNFSSKDEIIKFYFNNILKEFLKKLREKTKLLKTI